MRPQSSSVARPRRSAIKEFSPREALVREAKTDAIIDFAQRVKDWPLLDRAVDQKIEDQREFMGWWSENVRGRGKKRNNAEQGYFVDDAESLTGITQQQVSRWRARLAREEEYRAALRGAAYQAAMGEVHNHRAQGTGAIAPQRAPELGKLAGQ